MGVLHAVRADRDLMLAEGQGGITRRRVHPIVRLDMRAQQQPGGRCEVEFQRAAQAIFVPLAAGRQRAADILQGGVLLQVTGCNPAPYTVQKLSVRRPLNV